MKKILHNNKAQVAGTIAWTVATFAILIIIFTSVFIASLLGGAKTLTLQRTVKVFSQPQSIDLFAKESLVSYLLTDDSSGTPVYQQIIQDPGTKTGAGDLNDFNGPLAEKIFGNLYGGYYNNYVFFGVIESRGCALFNNYFNLVSSQVMCFSGVQSTVPIVTYIMKLNNERSVKLLLWKTQ